MPPIVGDEELFLYHLLEARFENWYAAFFQNLDLGFIYVETNNIITNAS